ncbi:MAG: hypothetical protein D6675_12855 [Gemmatimonadetes bacterium]|nr:MAG: hypothetical protein D6675_12855 [Gemmatimonadota bacterium]
MYEPILKQLPFHRQATAAEVESFLGLSPASIAVKVNDLDDCLYVSDDDEVNMVLLRPCTKGFEICFFNNQEIRGTNLFVNRL